jgi:hypothetical protein
MTRPATAAPQRVVEDGRTWVQIRVAARRLGITKGRVYHLVADGRLKMQEHLGLIYVDWKSVQQYARFQQQLQHLRTKMTPLG